MITLPLGFVALISILLLSMHGSLERFVQIHSFVIVIGGTFAILLFMTPLNNFKSIAHKIRALFKSEENFFSFKEELLELTKSRKLKSASQNRLISYAVELWEQGIDPELFIVLLSQKKKEIDSTGIDAITTLKNMAKYPPAMGMAGTVMGMIDLFASLDSNKSSIGVSLSIAMTATFFGLILTNGLIGPLADRLQVQHVRDQKTLAGIYETLLLINRNEPSVLISEDMEKRVA